MEISDDLLALFTATVVERNGSYILELPDTEISHGDVQPGGTYRVGILTTGTDSDETVESTEYQAVSNPPVEEGETRMVEIETIGEQGDGIARVERGYVIIVPETDVGDRVEIEVTDVRENVAFAEVLTPGPSEGEDLMGA